MVDVLLTHSYHLPYDPNVTVFYDRIQEQIGSETVDAGLLWQQVFDLEPKTRNPEATILAQSASNDIRTQKLVPLHGLAAAGRQI